MDVDLLRCMHLAEKKKSGRTGEGALSASP